VTEKLIEKKMFQAGCWWLPPVHSKLPGKLRLGGSWFQASPGEGGGIWETSISMGKRRAWLCVPIIPAMAGSVNRRLMVQAGLGKKRHPISKIIRAKKAGGMAQILEFLPSTQVSRFKPHYHFSK
jgi:hypothetical protein